MLSHWHRAITVIGVVPTVILLSLAHSSRAQTPENITVTAIMGQAYYSTNAEYWRALRAGDSMRLGDVVHAGPDSAVELFLGVDAGYLRVTENSQLTLEDYVVNEVYKQSDLRLILTEGAVVGFSNHVASTSDYKIKMSHGVVGVAASQFRVDASGFFVCLDGALDFTRPGDDGLLKTEIMKAPPACYYTPNTGVRLAPYALVQEVLGQSTGELPKASKRKKKTRTSL